MGRADLIGPGKHRLVPSWQPAGTGEEHEGRRRPQGTKPFRTQHTGLPDAARAKSASARSRGKPHRK
jgi:hypothetical protein